ncbi:hypothetical protein ACHAPU_008451 [Fusarium lateritium]
MDANATLQEDVTLFRQFMRVMHLLRHQNTIQPPVLPTPSTSDHSNDAAVQDGATESEENDSWDSDDDSIDSDEHSDMDQDMMSGQQHRAQDLEDQDSYDFEQEDEDESDYTMDTDISGDYLEESQQTPAPGFHSPGPDPDPPAAFDSITVQPPPQPPSSPDTTSAAGTTVVTDDGSQRQATSGATRGRDCERGRFVSVLGAEQPSVGPRHGTRI